MFIGRTKEINLLQNLYQKKTASFVICKGRRRIGKSRLIQEFGKTANMYLEFQGLPPQEATTNQDQLNAFSFQLSKQTKLPNLKLSNWSEAFSLLNSVIGNKKTVIFLDEISWMGSKDINFTGYLKIAWDTEWKKNPHLIVVICGSVSSWIEKNILNNTGFLGRASLELNLDELSLQHSLEFWHHNKKNRISSLEILKMLSVTGGVPRYLEEINSHISTEENVKRLCYTQEGVLFSEFKHIFTDIFSKRASIYKQITISLIHGSKTLSEISRHIKKEKNGHLSESLEDLVLSGFLAKDTVYSVTTQKKTSKVKYRLKDNYLRFYLRYIEPHIDKIKQGLVDLSELHLESFIEWEIIMGLQFENLVLNNLPLILKKLTITPNAVISASPYYQNKTNTKKACQIDLLIQTKHTLFVCEIKFRKKLDKKIISEVQQKIEALKAPKHMSIRPILISATLIDPLIKQEEYFDSCLSFDEIIVQDKPGS